MKSIPKMVFECEDPNFCTTTAGNKENKPENEKNIAIIHIVNEILDAKWDVKLSVKNNIDKQIYKIKIDF